MSIEMRSLSACLIIAILLVPFHSIILADNTDSDEGGWQCPQCGEWNQESYNFCAECGEPKPGSGYETHGKKKWICPGCGEKNDIADEYCFYCGVSKPSLDNIEYVTIEENKTPFKKKLGMGFMIGGGISAGAGFAMYIASLTSTAYEGGASYYAFLLAGIPALIGGGALLVTGLFLYSAGCKEEKEMSCNFRDWSEEELVRNYGERWGDEDNLITIFNLGMTF